MRLLRSAHRCVGSALALTAAVLLPTAATVSAQGDDPALEPPAEIVEATGAATAPRGGAAAQESSTELPWYERLTFSGDFRSRYEGFFQNGETARSRGRLRLRLRVDTDINEDVRFQLQVASGDPGTPVSTNQTFTSFFRPKPFSLDRAYLTYNPVAASAMTLGAGKFAFPQAVTQMVFDEDLNFEGSWEQVNWSPTNWVDVNLVAMQTIVNELPTDADAYMLAGYGEVTLDLGKHSFKVSAANYGWENVDQLAVGRAVGPLRSILTNGVVRNDQGVVTGFVSGFNVVDVIAEARVQTGRAEYPLRFLVDIAHNTRAAPTAIAVYGSRPSTADLAAPGPGVPATRTVGSNRMSPPQRSCSATCQAPTSVCT